MKFTIKAIGIIFFIGLIWATEPVDLEMVTKIRQEAFKNSKVMDTLSYLTESIGPRLSNSPQMMEANKWTKKTLEEWGLDNVYLDSWGPFGRGWSYQQSDASMVSPQEKSLRILPKAWSTSTNGPVTGEVLMVSISTKKDMEKWKGKLKNKILFVSKLREYTLSEKKKFSRYSEEELHDIEQFEIRGGRRGGDGWKKRYMKRMKLRKLLPQFFVDEGVLALVSNSYRMDGNMAVSGGGSRKIDDVQNVPQVVMQSVHYNQIARAIKNKETVQLKLNIQTTFHDDKDEMGHNTIGEIKGHGRLKKEIVMVGAHMDSWHAGTGATDNAAGVAVAMEAVRILKSLGVELKRTVRIGLWSAEEQGLIGSAEYIKAQFADYPEQKDPEQKKLPSWLQDDRGELQYKKEHKLFSGYFNLDNGAGKIRGIYAQENAAIVPIFKAWLKPFHDLGATVVTMKNTGSTDHASFDRVGLPGFQFVQDRLDYFTLTHHTELDVIEHIVPQDLQQASAIMASFLYHAAMRDEKLPRKPKPKPKKKKKKKKEAS